MCRLNVKAGNEQDGHGAGQTGRGFPQRGLPVGPRRIPLSCVLCLSCSVLLHVPACHACPEFPSASDLFFLLLPSSLRHTTYSASYHSVCPWARLSCSVLLLIPFCPCLVRLVIHACPARFCCSFLVACPARFGSSFHFARLIRLFIPVCVACPARFSSFLLVLFIPPGFPLVLLFILFAPPVMLLISACSASSCSPVSCLSCFFFAVCPCASCCWLLLFCSCWNCLSYLLLPASRSIFPSRAFLLCRARFPAPLSWSYDLSFFLISGQLFSVSLAGAG